MEFGLNKRQLQQTLREMGVEFPPGASREDLKDILDQANQKQWLRVARSGSTGRGGRIIRRRGPNLQQPAEIKDLPEKRATEQPPPSSSISSPKAEYAPWERQPSTPEAKPGSEKHANARIFDRTKDLKAYAISRAKGVCDLCEKHPDHTKDGRPAALKPCFFIDPPEDRPHTFKTVAALCPDCFDRVNAEPSLSDIRLLKRKARQTRAGQITVTKKKRPPVARKPRSTGRWNR